MFVIKDMTITKTRLTVKKAMKKTRLRKKSKRKSVLKTAMRICEEAWKAAVKRRARGICEVHGPFCPDPVKQIDHFRSRRHGHTFFMLENGTQVCRSLNMQKAMGVNNAAEKIAFVVLEREGQSMMDYLLEISRQPKKWTLDEIEEQTKKLNGMF